GDQLAAERRRRLAGHLGIERWGTGRRGGSRRRIVALRPKLSLGRRRSVRGGKQDKGGATEQTKFAKRHNRMLQHVAFHRTASLPIRRGLYLYSISSPTIWFHACATERSLARLQRHPRQGEGQRMQRAVTTSRTLLVLTALGLCGLGSLSGCTAA